MVRHRVRFAPSPTGYLHVGGLRTALFNCLFAANTQGKAILRLEDTDRKRSVKGATENLQESLRWTGIQFDEGFHIGGPDAPYVQSKRLELYRKYTDRLVAQGNAYYCFCTAKELAGIREEQLAQKRATSYNGRCRTLSQEEIRARQERGLSCTVRLKIPCDRTEYCIRDTIRGEVRIQSDQIDDQILLKSDGFPTYHLANVVDDHLMRITHVIRGEEWLPSTPKHLQIYEYLGWKPPQFAHLPLLLNPDRSKLSKRRGDVTIEEYRAKGFLPEALINFVALLGWSPEDGQELHSVTELTEKFSLDRVGKAGAIFDVEKLKWMNRQYIKRKTGEELYPLVFPFLPDCARKAERGEIVKILGVIKDGMVQLTDAAEKLALFFNESPELTDSHLLHRAASEQAQKVYRAFIAALEKESELTARNFAKVVKQVQKETGIKGKGLYGPLRIAITLAEQGPDLSSVAKIFGRDKCLTMVRNLLVDG